MLDNAALIRSLDDAVNAKDLATLASLGTARANGSTSRSTPSAATRADASRHEPTRSRADQTTDARRGSR
jgi:hypothetical protein